MRDTLDNDKAVNLRRTRKNNEYQMGLHRINYVWMVLKIISLRIWLMN